MFAFRSDAALPTQIAGLPVERRLFTTIVLATAFLLFYVSLRPLVVPPPAKVAEQPVEDELAEAGPDDPANRGEGDGDPQAESDSDADTSADPAESGQQTAAEQGEGAEAGNANDAVSPADPTRPSQQWKTLGSMDPIAGHRILVTLSTLGVGSNALS